MGVVGMCVWFLWLLLVPLLQVPVFFFVIVVAIVHRTQRSLPVSMLSVFLRLTHLVPQSPFGYKLLRV